MPEPLKPEEIAKHAAGGVAIALNARDTSYRGPIRHRLRNTARHIQRRNSGGPTGRVERAQGGAATARKVVVNHRLVEREPPTEPRLLCPSTPGSPDDSILIGVVTSHPEGPRVVSTQRALPVTPEILKIAEPVSPSEPRRVEAVGARTSRTTRAGLRCEALPC